MLGNLFLLFLILSILMIGKKKFKNELLLNEIHLNKNIRNVYRWGHRRKNSLGDPHGFSGVLALGVLWPAFVFPVELAGAGLRCHDFWWPQVPCLPVKEGCTDSGKSASCPFSIPLPEPCDAYLGSAELWNEVIQEAESLWQNYLCILGPLFSWRVAGSLLPLTPLLLTWLKQLWWGRVPGARPCVDVQVLPRPSGWGPMAGWGGGVGGWGSPSKAQSWNYKVVIG